MVDVVKDLENFVFDYLESSSRYEGWYTNKFQDGLFLFDTRTEEWFVVNKGDGLVADVLDTYDIAVPQLHIVEDRKNDYQKYYNYMVDYITQNKIIDILAKEQQRSWYEAFDFYSKWNGERELNRLPDCLEYCISKALHYYDKNN